MSLIKDILIYVDEECIDDFNTAVGRENLEITKIHTYTSGSLEKFAILAESISPYLKPVIGVIKQLVRVHKKKVIFEYQRKDGSVIKQTVDAYSKDDAIEIINESVRLSIKISQDDRS
jgi:hypothetical protein